MELGQANQNIFADTLLEFAKADRHILVVTSDSRGSGKLTSFGETLPTQLVEVGIAEQNLVGVSAGLASTGKKVFAVSPACFLTTRSLEQIKNDIAYSNNPVKLIGISAGVSYGALGSTHHSLHDYAALRTINNLDIIAPADNLETREAVKAFLEYPTPIYMRLGKQPMVNLHPADTVFKIGKAITIRDGSDLTFISIGEPTCHALEAAELLADEGISCRVISMHTLKPFDEETLLKAATETQAIITIEEHSIYGGLGERVSSILAEQKLCVPLKIIGIRDEYTVTGSQKEIFQHYGISRDGLAQTARKLLERLS